MYHHIQWNLSKPNLFGPTFVFGIDRYSVFHVIWKKKISYIEIYLKFGLYRIPIYSGFGLDRVSLYI
jgi:hypothetical protein